MTSHLAVLNHEQYEKAISEHKQACKQAFEASVAKRRAKIAEGLRQLKIDQDHWNRTHPDEEPISLDFDLTADVEAAAAVVAKAFPTSKVTP